MANWFVEELKKLGEVVEWEWKGWDWTDFEQMRTIEKPPPNAYNCYRTRYPNGFGASIVKHPGSYGYEDGLWEVGVIEWDDDGNENFHLTYETPITQDVEGYLDEDEVLELCKRIKKLKREVVEEEDE